MTISNKAYTFSLHDNDGNATDAAELIDTNTEGESKYKLKIKELNKEFCVTVIAAYQRVENGEIIPIKDTIYIKGNLTENTADTISWETNGEGEFATTGDITSLNLSINSETGETSGGYELRANAIFQMRFVGASSNAQDVWISNDSSYLKFEVCADSLSKVKLIEGDKLVFAGQSQDSLTANIYAYIETNDGLKIRQQYSISFS